MFLLFFGMMRFVMTCMYMFCPVHDLLTLKYFLACDSVFLWQKQKNTKKYIAQLINDTILKTRVSCKASSENKWLVNGLLTR